MLALAWHCCMLWLRGWLPSKPPVLLWLHLLGMLLLLLLLLALCTRSCCLYWYLLAVLGILISCDASSPAQ